MPIYTNSPEFAKAFRSLQGRSGVLDAGLLRSCRELELTAFNRHSDRLEDRCFECRLATLKHFVKRHHTAKFTLRVVADLDTARLICGVLGLPVCYQDVKQPATVLLKEFPTRVPEPVCFRCTDAEVYVWAGVIIRFPRDEWQRATIRDALVVLVAPCADPLCLSPARKRTQSRQLQLGFEGLP